MSDSFSDQQLDDQLRDVPVPERLLAELRQGTLEDSVNWSDEQLDREIATVPLPAGLLDRLSDCRPTSNWTGESGRCRFPGRSKYTCALRQALGAAFGFPVLRLRR